MVHVLHEQRETVLPGAHTEGDSLWLDRDEVELATGWAWKPEGLCRDDACMPLPRDPAASLARGARLDVAAVWRYLGHPVVHDDAGETWVLGTGAGHRAEALASLEAPGFELPDLEGRVHRLSDYRGSKVFLATWASW